MPIPESPTTESIRPVLESLPVPYVSVLRAGVVGKSGRMYTKDCLERAVADFQERVDKRLVFVHAPDRPGWNDLTNAIGVVKEAHFDGENVNIQVQFTNNVWRMANMMYPLGFSVEGSCAGSGNEIYQMEIHSFTVHDSRLKPAQD